jgi:hypothetical protein
LRSKISTEMAEGSRIQNNGGWPTFAVLAKVGTRAACILIFRSRRRCLRPTFPKNVKVGQPVQIRELS